MNNKWIIIDCSYVCHRAFHSMPGLQSGDVPTGVIFGFFKTLIALQERFRTTRLVFAFDSKGEGRRQKLLPTYKQVRHTQPLTDEETAARRLLYKQINDLRDKYLTQIGYRNVYHADGFEGDDVIASVCQNLPKGDTAVIVSADGDLYQLISSRVSFYNPHKNVHYTPNTFKAAFGIASRDWWMVKALAGCSTDEVPGIPKVGEKTAIKYLTGELKETSKIYAVIESTEGAQIWARNVPLVRLPFAGTPRFKPVTDVLDLLAWHKFVDKFGMSSIRDLSRVVQQLVFE